MLTTLMKLPRVLRPFTVALWIAASVWAPSAQAQWIVFDPTSFIQNSITAAESVYATTQRARDYVAQLQQYQTMLTNLKKLPASALGTAMGQMSQSQTEFLKGMGGFDKLQDIGSLSTEIGKVSGSLSNAQGSLASLIKLQQSMGGLQDGFSKRFEDARRMNLTWEQYAAQEDLQIRSRVSSAAFRAQEDIDRFARVKRDYEFAQEMAGKIPEAEGVQQSMAITNTLLNRMVTQVAEVNKGLSSALSAKSPEAQMAEELAKQRALDEKRTRLKNFETQRAADERALQNWGKN